MKDTFEILSKAAAVVTFLVLWLAFFYEFGFFTIVGRQLQNLLSGSDYLASAVLWLPATAFFSMIGLGIALTFSRADHFLTGAEIKKVNPKRYYLNNFPFDLTYYMLIGVGFLQILFGNPYDLSAGALTLAFLWLTFSSWFLRHDRLKDILNIPIVLIIIFAPVLTMIAYLNGISEGYRAVTQVGNVFSLKLKEVATPSNVQLYRSLASGVIVRDPVQSRIVFYRWDSLASISVRVAAPKPIPLSCRVIGINCQDFLQGEPTP